MGNRLTRTSTLAALGNQSFGYHGGNKVVGDSYTPNGATTAADGQTYAYNFENRIKSANNGAITIVYDGDGNRVSKTVGSVTTNYLVDENNPTGYAQVVEELVGGQVRRAYSYGNMLISQRQLVGASWVVSHYGYDGSGNVRQLFDNAGAVTDSFDYDAFGNLIARTGTTANSYLYRGQQFDADLGFYFLRARYYGQQRGRFWTVDTYAGEIEEPITLHKYLYANADPVNSSDPSGLATLVGIAVAPRRYIIPTKAYIVALAATIACIITKTGSTVLGAVKQDLGNPCINKFSKCEDDYPGYKRCDELPSNYQFSSSGGAFNQIVKEMRQRGYDTKGLRKEGPAPATGGPCVNTPGASHYNVRQSSMQWASIGECKCCEDNKGSSKPTLVTKCAILNRRY